MPIRILSDLIANQIAAGEVVEGALSVVKELVENSIDAGANSIAVELSKQLRYIKVSDNGSGIPVNELPLAFTRHATSKITEIEDLFSIDSNGFRGEALASIASVSRVTCISKTRSEADATKFYIDADREEVSSVGAGVGTSIEVDELFYNTPARLKFMKSVVKEKQNIIDLLKAFSIFNPNVSFELLIDGKTQFKVLKDQPFKVTARELFGKSVFEHLINFEYNTGAIKVSGYLSAPELNRSDKRYYFTAVNKRIIKCNTIRSAVDRVYKDLLPVKKYPIIIINLELPSSDVDVNVHPRKQEVKYLHANEVYRTLITAISTDLSEYFYKCSEYKQLEIFNPVLADLEPHADSDLSGEERPSLFSEREYTPSILRRTNDRSVISSDAEPATSIEDCEQSPLETGVSESGIMHQSRCDSDKTLSFLTRFPSIEVNFIEGDLSDYLEGISFDEREESFKIFSANADQSFGFLVTGKLFPVDESIQDLYLDSLEVFTKKLLETKSEDNLLYAESNSLKELAIMTGGTSLDKQAATKLLSKKKPATKLSRPSIKPPLGQLEEIWARDNYSCVYCAKALIHPKVVKQALLRAESESISWLNARNEKISEHLIEAHKASFDHHLPASKFAVLNLDSRNLFATCRECNQRKSASLASKTWTPRQVNSWANFSINNPLELAGVKFISALEAIYDN
ncbi:MAG: DNA mismatch repair endonuclease MutL [Vampirovibrionia bacterium]